MAKLPDILSTFYSQRKAIQAFNQFAIETLINELPNDNVPIRIDGARNDLGYRLLVSQPQRLFDAIKKEQFAGFGFFGELLDKEDTTLRQAVNDADDALIARLPAFPKIYAYCSWELSTNVWGNLVWIEDLTAIGQFMSKTNHKNETVMESKNWFKTAYKPQYEIRKDASGRWHMDWQGILLVNLQDQQRERVKLKPDLAMSP